MIRHEHERALDRRGFEVFETVNVHQIVGRHLNPARAYLTLTPRPETFPTSLIHLMRLKESETLDSGKDGDLLGRWVYCLFGVQSPMSKVQSPIPSAVL